MNWLKTHWLAALIVGVVVIALLGFGGYYEGFRIWNGIGNFFFHREIAAKQEQVNKELAEGAKQKILVEQTLRELAQAKEELAKAKAETDRLIGIFNDSSKTSSAKVAEFKKAVADDPVHTPTDNVTVSDLCTRAKIIGASAATIAALCR